MVRSEEAPGAEGVDAPGDGGSGGPRGTGSEGAGPVGSGGAGPVGSGGAGAGGRGDVGSGGSGGARAGDEGAGDDRWLAVVMHVAFFVLLLSSLARYLHVHPHAPATPWVAGLAVLLGALYLLGPVVGPVPARTATSVVWLAAVFGCWLVLVTLAPSFGYCAVSLFFTALRSLSTRVAIVLVAVLTACVVAAQLKLRLRFGFDANLFLAPPAVAAVATAVFVHSKRQAARLQRAVADLVDARRELAATERREGTLAERQRLSYEIHDTLAQGLSSQQMLLQAAERVWTTDPEAALRHTRSARAVAEHNLAEARRFVHDLAPADLADGAGLDSALRTLAAREDSSDLHVRFRQDGTPAELPENVRAALVRIAQGALANAREHARATTVTLTLTYLDDQVLLDIADDGRGFAPAATASTGVRGHGLPAMRARVRQLGGTLGIESAPGEGTVVTAAVPLVAEGGAPGDAAG
ncbi:sensor histidine kinase [Streptomyces sp. NPDC087440]|uniref:sensor histidine kinase n=1 Tax=Streptomyces sp. NPDC087440 TaxID=3365790 RepID=UPI0038182715